MQFSLATVIFGLAAFAAATPAAPASALLARADTATGTCCFANKSLKQDICTSETGAAGKCVPGGNACGSSLSCVADSKLACDDTIKERSGVLCRAIVNGGFQDGARVVKSLKDAKAN
ncbi:hypothetical protein MCOR25_007760 [Pyricularia grisea]|uniref:Extracellular membrane protein CFEM domain-containing protein n=1 Tax=Pyricularia grisea TaxID=148305 RepID=A0A6P8BHL6_PYRGI|nr:uncharacterized protein PgNI_02085 [Pyricularia grisea]KAI6357062.1 hypothetical protein MCOR25_007760 [Pyricularia grisea]TLD16220.1 hypothetical protein PgNI_02085 [Pyricularia grisea]